MFSHVYIIPGMDCPARCVYCYEKKTESRMSSEVQESIKRFLNIQFNNCVKKNIPPSQLIEFYGGEPLLYLDKVLDISSYVHNLYSAFPNSYYKGAITTNAILLTFDTFKKLIEVGITDFQITLDGPKHVHDQRRILANGKGTFDIIWQRLLAAKQSNLSFNIVIRLHVTPDNFNDIKEFTQNELSIFREDSRFSIQYKELVALGGKNDNKLNLFTSEEAEIALAPLRARETLKLPRTCYASNPSSICILPSGNLCKCTVELENGVVGKLNSDGTVSINQSLFNAWTALWTHPEEEYMCPRKLIKMAQSSIPMLNN